MTVNSPVKLLSASILALALLVGILVWNAQRGGSAQEGLLLYCAVVIQNPMEVIARDFQSARGVPVNIQYGGSGTLLSQLQVVKEGDLYLAADQSYTERAIEEGLVSEAVPVAVIHPVIAVAKGNPKQINGLGDLLKPGVRTALANPDTASIGKQTQLLLERLGYWQSVQSAAHERGVFKPTVTEVANDIALGAVDAGIIWDVTVMQYPKLEAVSIAGAEDADYAISIGVLESSKKRRDAHAFIQFLTSPEDGGAILQRFGFTPAPPAVVRSDD